FPLNEASLAMPIWRPWRLCRCGRPNPAHGFTLVESAGGRRMSIRALIVDDEAPARGELRYLLAAHPEVEVVGEAATAAEALALVSAGGARTLLDYDAVYWIEADGDYSRVHAYDRAYLSTSSLRELGETLPAARFARIHRSHLVNLGKVAAVRRGGPDRLRLV